MAGIVGKSKFTYDLLGATVRTARAIHASPKQNVIQVTEAVRENLDGLFEFEPVDAGAMVSRNGKGPITIWELKQRAAASLRAE
jgi:class 3 adenylate cyclase